MTIRYTNILIIATIILVGYICCMWIRLGTNFDLNKLTMVGVPHDIKCAFGESYCEQNDITAFTLVMSILYFIVGYNIPDYYITVFTLSVGFQIFLYNIGSNSSFIVDPLANMTGYALGSVLSTKNIY